MNKNLSGITLLFSIIAIIIPLLGLILGIVYVAKDNKEDRLTGAITIAVSTVAFIFWLAIFISGTNTNNLYDYNSL